MNDPVLDVQNVSYSYRSDWSFRRKHALTDISFSVGAGECFGFLGHNGAGKTTTIKCILSLLRPTSGRVLIAGRPAHEADARRSVGYLPEQPYFYDHVTVQELLEMYATLSGVPAGDRLQAVEHALARVRMLERKAAPMRSLSKGLVQRVGLAQAIVGHPKLLILDEPFSGLDPIGRREFRELFTEMKGHGATIVICTHVLKDIEHLCDRVGILVRGSLRGVHVVRDLATRDGGTYELELVAEADAAKRCSDRAVSFEARGGICRLTFGDRVAAEAALQRAIAQGIRVDSYQFNHASLEDFFIAEVQRATNGESLTAPLEER